MITRIASRSSSMLCSRSAMISLLIGLSADGLLQVCSSHSAPIVAAMDECDGTDGFDPTSQPARVGREPTNQGARMPVALHEFFTAQLFSRSRQQLRET